MAPQHIRGKDEFRKDNPVLVMLLPEDGRMKRLVIRQMNHTAPVIKDRQRRIEAAHAVNGLDDVDQKPAGENRGKKALHERNRLRTCGQSSTRR